MNAVNLITMLFAAQEAVAPHSQTDGQPLPNSSDFMLQLQQQVLGGSGLVAIQPDRPDAVVEEMPATTPLLASFITGNGWHDTNQSWSLGELLAALIDSLRQVLDAAATRTQTALPAGNQPIAPQDVTQFGTAVPVSSAATAAGQTGGRHQQLLQSLWNEVVNLLSRQLAAEHPSLAEVRATALTAGQGGTGGAAMPYASLLLARQPLSAAITNVAIPSTQDYPLITTPGILADAPASIQWFNTLGLLGQSRSAIADNAAPATMTAELALSDGSIASINLTELEPAATAAQRVFEVSIKLPGEGATLSAMLTIQRLPPAVTTLLPELQAVPVIPTAAIAGAIPAEGSTAADAAELWLASPEAGGAQVIAGKDTGVVAEGKVLPVTAATYELPVAETARPDGGYAVTEQLRPAAKSVPTLIAGEPAAQAAAARQTAVNRHSWTAQMALDQLNGTQQQPVIVTLKQQPAQPAAQVQLATSQQPSLEAVAVVAVNAGGEPLAPQLMEFVGSRFETSQFAGLEYLEMAQRIMDRVATARSAGNGLYNAHLDLNPPNLGKMFVNISVRGDAVALQIAVASTVPREQLKDSLDALRQSLEDAGLYVIELQVHEVDGDEDHSGGQQQSSAEQDENAHKDGETVMKSTPSLSAAFKTTPAIGFGG